MNRLLVFKGYLQQLNWLIVILTLLVFSGLIKLGLWQSDRAIEKEQRLTRIEQYSQQAAINLEQVLLMQSQSEDINDLPIELEGSFETQELFLLDNQTNKGRLGYRVYQVMQLQQYQVLVNLGWVSGSKIRSELPKVKAINGQHKVMGNIRVIEQGIILAEQEFQQVTWPLRVQQIELDKFSHIIGQKLLPFVVYLDKNDSLGFEKNWQPIVMPPAKHRGYAFQWFSLALAWITLMISASIWFYKNKAE